MPFHLLYEGCEKKKRDREQQREKMSANWVFNQKVCLFTFNCFYGKSVSLSRRLLF